MDTHAVEAPKCPLCDGTGWKTSSVERGVRKVQRCDCRLAARCARLLEQAGIPAQYAHCSLDNFSVAFPGATKSLDDALFFARKFVEKYPSERTGMLLSGPCGTGKTHLAIAILKGLIQQWGARCLFRGYSALLKQIQATFGGQILADEETGIALTEYSILQDVVQTDVLVLDDLGAEKSSEWTLSMLYHVINERYSNRRTTIITTNVPWEGIEDKAPEKQSESAAQASAAMRVRALRGRVSARTYSRIAELCPHKLELDGVDFRQTERAW
jgi:DNA replication protein DnaC